MIVIPAVDLRQGNCVRLRHGNVEEETIYSSDPVAMAKKWVDQGAQRLHIVDLDGALSGELKNFDWVLKIKKSSNVVVQFGGGIRTFELIEKILGEGIDRVILGTLVFEEAGLAQRAFSKYKDRIMVAIDAKNGMVATRGWRANSGFPIGEALAVVEKLGGTEIIYTDIGRDGTLEGVNIMSLKEVMSKTNMKVFASGGVSSIKDIEKLKEINSPGCIVGKAIYDEKLLLIDALKLAG